MSFGHFLIKKEATKERERAAFLVVVGKNIFSRAVDRNMLKRRMRAVARELGFIKNNKNMKIKVIARPGSEKLSYAEIRQALKTNLDKLL